MFNLTANVAAAIPELSGDLSPTHVFLSITNDLGTPRCNVPEYIVLEEWKPISYFRLAFVPVCVMVRILGPPSSAIPGDIVTFHSYPGLPPDHVSALAVLGATVITAPAAITIARAVQRVLRRVPPPPRFLASLSHFSGVCGYFLLPVLSIFLSSFFPRSILMIVLWRLLCSSYERHHMPPLHRRRYIYHRSPGDTPAPEHLP